MIRNQLAKVGFWSFVLCLCGFLAINYRLNSLEKARLTEQAAAAKIFTPVPNSLDITSVTIQNESESELYSVEVLILPHLQQVEYQPNLANASYNFEQKNNTLLVRITPSKTAGDRVPYDYSAITLRLPAHLTRMDFKGVRAKIAFHSELQLNEVAIATLNADINITNLHANLLTLKDEPRDKTSKYTRSINFSGINAINQLDARLSDSSLLLNDLDAKHTQSIRLDLSGKADIQAGAEILQKVAWGKTAAAPNGGAN